MKNVIIFGTEQFAQLALYYLSNTEEYDVVAFTVNRSYKKKNILFEKPIVDFEDIEELYPPSEYFLFAPMSGKNLNKIREKIYFEGKQKGYTFISYISKFATILSDNIGENCFILENNVIQPYTQIGNNCVLWSGNHIGHHSIIKDHVFIASHVVISGNCIIEKYSWLGVNCTIRNNLIIGEGTIVSMGACVLKNTNEYTLYIGVPAKEKGNSTEPSIMGSL